MREGVIVGTGIAGGANETTPIQVIEPAQQPTWSRLGDKCHRSHVRVFRSMAVIMHTHAIPPIGTLTKVKTKSKSGWS